MMPSKTALFNAAKHWDAKTVDMLLSAAPALMDVRDSRGRNALHLACSVKPGTAGTREPNGIRTVTTLLRHGADLHGFLPLENGSFKATPVWWAVAHGDNLPLVRMLLKKGARADNCLWAVVWNDNTEILREILKANPPLDDREGGEPVIVSAVRWKKLKTLELLMKAGADVSVPDRKGRDAIFHARAKKLPAAIIARLEALRSGP
jgi:ankyrin repeat protein